MKISIVVGTRPDIGGGDNNNVDANYGIIGGGQSNSITDADWSFIGGGQDNIIQMGLHNAISGGQNNQVPTGDNNAIGGGFQNLINGYFCAIPGGSMNNITPGVGPVDHSLAFGNQVDCNTPFEVLFFEAAMMGFLRINCDDLDAPIAGIITVGTNPANGNGAFLTPGGVWTNTSSRDKKDNFAEVDGAEVLSMISNLPIESWQYKGSTERHIWPCSEDFVKLFDVGITNGDGSREDSHLAAGDIAGVALAGVKELTKENEELRQIVRELTQRIEQLENNNR